MRYESNPVELRRTQQSVQTVSNGQYKYNYTTVKEVDYLGTFKIQLSSSRMIQRN